jgi:putative nucleotidyltransferase with HDIG domain
MSDILKKLKQDEEAKERKEKQPLEPKQPGVAFPTPPSPQSQPGAPKEKESSSEKEPKTSEVRVSPVIRGTRGISEEDTKKLYEEMFSLIKGIMKKKPDPASININKITKQVERLVDALGQDNEVLIFLALTRDSIDTYYLFSHILNVCILAIEVGKALNYEKDSLILLGIAALLHDIGMAHYTDIANQPRKLTLKEYNEIKHHSLVGAGILAKVKGLDKMVLRCAEQHHERMDGSGYPRSIKDEFIDKFAKIISAVDVYEAMMHPRVYRTEHPSVETMQEILANKKAFEYRIIKILIEHIGIFPIGSYVALNTQEKAQVIRLNRKVPLRPVVEIVVSAAGEKLKESKIIDLSQELTIYITGGIRKSELEKKHPTK